MSEVLLLTSGRRVHADGCEIGRSTNRRATEDNISCPAGEHADGRRPDTDLTGARRIAVNTGRERPPARRAGTARTPTGPRRDAPARAAALVANRPGAPQRRAVAPVNRALRPLTDAEVRERDLVASTVADGLGRTLAHVVGGVAAHDSTTGRN